MKIGNTSFDFDKEAIIMGILNVTPDSFSDGGQFNTIDMALKHTEEMINDGARIIDVGGESTRPGYTLISEEEEIERVSPVIAAIKNNFDIPISLDTYKSKVALEGIKAGADLINDIWGLKYKDKSMAKIVGQNNVSVCIMHNRNNTAYNDFVTDTVKDLEESIKIANEAKIDSEKIILDPGVGFAKNYEQNLEIINYVNQVVRMGYPVLLGTSRKSVIGLALDVPKNERMVGTVATTVMGYERGCRIFRVHDVKENFQALKMAMAINSMK